MKKFIVILLIALIFSVMAVSAAAGTLSINNVGLPASGLHRVSDWQTKSTTSNGTRVWFDQTVGPLAAVNTRTQANLPGVGVVDANPDVKVYKGNTEWLGSYTTINLLAGTPVRIHLWTGTFGYYDTVTGNWYYY